MAAGYSGHNVALARYNTDGSLDTTFDGDGKLIAFFEESEDQANAVAVQTDGKIVVGGQSDTASSGPYTLSARFSLARYTTAGTLDTTFGTGGKVIATFGSNSTSRLNALALQPDGKIVAAGSGVFEGDGLPDFVIARYNPDGTLDTTFSDDGRDSTDFHGDNFLSSDSANAVAIQSDGKIVLVGAANDSATSERFALVRYNTDGTLDTTFDGDGKVTTTFLGFVVSPSRPCYPVRRQDCSGRIYR